MAEKVLRKASKQMRWLKIMALGVGAFVIGLIAPQASKVFDGSSGVLHADVPYSQGTYPPICTGKYCYGGDSEPNDGDDSSDSDSDSDSDADGADSDADCDTGDSGDTCDTG